MGDAPRQFRVTLATMRLAAGVCLAVALSAAHAAAIEFGPQGAVRQFCQADSRGHRATVAGWAAFAPLVAWPLEPAWDHVVLIAGYTVGGPRQLDEETLEIEVRYDVIGQVSAFGFDTTVYVETYPFRVHTYDGTAWRILGPPPPPHIAVSRVEVQAMRASFESGSTNFMPNSLFVTHMYRSAGWRVPAVRTTELLASRVYRRVDEPEVGDLVLFLDAGTPYHVGLLDEPSVMVSSTINAGVVRTPIDAFPGEIEFARLVRPEAGPPEAGLGAAAAAEADGAATRARTPAARTAVTAAPAKRPTPKPAHVTRSAPGKHPTPKRRAAVTRSAKPTPAGVKRKK